MTTPTEELRETLTKLAEGARIAYVRWEKDQSYDGEKVEYDLVEDALDQLLALIIQQTLEAAQYGRVKSVEDYMNTCLAQGIQPTMKTLLEFQAGQKLALAQLKKGQEKPANCTCVELAPKRPYYSQHYSNCPVFKEENRAIFEKGQE